MVGLGVTVACALKRDIAWLHSLFSSLGVCRIVARIGLRQASVQEQHHSLGYAWGVFWVRWVGLSRSGSPGDEH